MYIIYEISIFIFILLSSFFSATETAIISANIIKLKTLAERGNKRAKRAFEIVNHIDDSVGMTLIGNNIANVASASFITFIATKILILNSVQIIIITAIQTMLFLIFCEIFPKVVARSKSNSFIIFFSYPISILMFLLKPAIKTSLFITEGLKRLFRLKNINTSIIRSRDEIGVLFQLGKSEGIIDKNHHEFIDEILSLHEITVNEVMTPTIDIISIEKKDSIKQLVMLIEKTRYSRIPVYDERVDNIIGFVYYRDILNRRNIKSIGTIIHKPYYVPTTKRIDELFTEMLDNKISISFVVNEFGGVEGLVTKEDIIEEVVGEIQTRDHSNEDLIRKIDDKKFIIQGGIDIEYFKREFGLNIVKKGFETLAGFMNYKFGKIPSKGDTVKIDGYIFVIDKATDKSVEEIIVKVPKKIKVK